MKRSDIAREKPGGAKATRGALAAVAAAAGLAGCATGDHFATRLSTYNKEAELAQQQAILLNILRASRRRPLSFIELQNVTSSGTPSGSLALGLPLSNIGATPYSATPTLNLSGGPTLSAVYLGSQEFYQGLLKPIPASTIDLFMKRGLSPDLLFNLFFSEITISGTPTGGSNAGRWSHPVRNYVGDDKYLDAFQLLVRTLLNARLTTAPDDSDPPIVGPPLTPEAMRTSSLMVKAAAAGLTASEVSWCDLDALQQDDLLRSAPKPLGKLPDVDAACAILSPENPAQTISDEEQEKYEHKLSGALAAFGLPAEYFVLRAKAGDPSYKLCFKRPDSAPILNSKLKSGEEKGLCDDESTHELDTSKTIPLTVPEFVMPNLCKFLYPSKGPFWIDAAYCAVKKPYKLKLSFTPRSTFVLIFYLGEVFRRAHYPDYGYNLKPVRAMTGQPDRDYPPVCPSITEGNDGYDKHKCRTIFNMVEIKRPTEDRRAVSYDGLYWIIPDGLGRWPNGHLYRPTAVKLDYTDEVLDIVNELIALNHAAKDTPRSSILSVVGVP